MKQEQLFDIPKDRASQKELLHRFCKANGIWTHTITRAKASKDFPAWTALLLPSNPHGIELPYVQDETEPMEIIAGYCRVLDESGMLVEGETEREAVEILCRNLNIPFELCPALTK